VDHSLILSTLGSFPLSRKNFALYRFVEMSTDTCLHSSSHCSLPTTLHFGVPISRITYSETFILHEDFDWPDDAVDFKILYWMAHYLSSDPSRFDASFS
jgi:hypothetical protein